jgi:hypothetical protein
VFLKTVCYIFILIPSSFCSRLTVFTPAFYSLNSFWDYFVTLNFHLFFYFFHFFLIFNFSCFPFI